MSSMVAAEVHLALFFLDGDAGIVADALTHAGQGVEQSGFAGVGIADRAMVGVPNDHNSAPICVSSR